MCREIVSSVKTYTISLNWPKKKIESSIWSILRNVGRPPCTTSQDATPNKYQQIKRCILKCCAVFLYLSVKMDFGSQRIERLCITLNDRSKMQTLMDIFDAFAARFLEI